MYFTDHGDSRRHAGRQTRVVVFCLVAMMSLFVLVACGNEPGRKTSTPAAAREVTRAPIPEAAAETAPAGPGSEAVPPPVLFDAPAFQLTDQDGKPYGTDDLAGKVWVVNFMFTRCTATCPRQTDRLAELQRLARRWPDWDRVRFLSISVDPEHDTTARLAEYADRYRTDPEHWKFLTGPLSELYRISRDGFKMPVTEAARDGSKPITHSSRFILVDGTMKIRAFHDSLENDAIRNILVDLRSLLGEPAGEDATLHVGIPADVFSPPWLEQRRADQLASAGEIDAFHDFTFADRLE